MHEVAALLREYDRALAYTDQLWKDLSRTTRTFAVNYLAHAQLIGDLLGSNTYHANFWRKLLGVAEARWADPVELARPATDEQAPSMTASGVAYSNAKLAILYYAQ